jgi:GNAT superfamily N-acetyltransferase
MTSPSTVRIAKPEDKIEIWRLFMLGYQENAQFRISPQKVNFFLDRALNPNAIHPLDDGPRGAIGVIGEVGSLEGLAFVIFGNYWYSDERHLEELIVYVDPAHRRSRHAHALVNWMKFQSDLTGLPLVTGIISTERTEAKVALYERLLPKVGAFFLYGGKGSIHGSSAAFA